MHYKILRMDWLKINTRADDWFENQFTTFHWLKMKGKRSIPPHFHKRHERDRMQQSSAGNSPEEDALAAFYARVMQRVCTSFRELDPSGNTDVAALIEMVGHRLLLSHCLRRKPSVACRFNS